MEGIGPKTVEKLLREFGSAKRVRAASDEELIKTIGPAATRKIRDHFSSPESQLPESQLKVLQ